METVTIAIVTVPLIWMNDIPTFVNGRLEHGVSISIEVQFPLQLESLISVKMR